VSRNVTAANRLVTAAAALFPTALRKSSYAD
jgi:hypothetical protein